MTPRLSIKGLIAAAFAIILVLALAATGQLLVTERLTREALARHEQAMRHAHGDGTPLSAAEFATHHELAQAIALGTRMTLAMRIASFLIGLGLAVVVYRRVARMVGSAEDFARRIERGDLTARLAADAGGEADLLAAAINRMVERLHAFTLGEAELRLGMESLLDASSNGIYGIDRDGNCTWCNNAASRLIGRKREELLGHNMHALLHHSRADGSPYPAQECRLYRVMADGEGVRVDDEVFWRADGTAFPVEYWSYPTRLHDRITGAVVYFEDITARKALEEDLARRDAILGAVAYGSARFLGAGALPHAAQWNLAAEAVLSHLGEATGVSRIWVVENTRDPAGDVTLRVAHRWALPAFAVPDADPLFAQRRSYEGEGLGVEALRLRRGELLQLRPADLPPPVRADYARLGIRSQVLAPVKAGEAWWGFIAFDDCADERIWSETELEALRTAANLFGAALLARGRQAELHDSLESLDSALEKLRRQSAEIARQNAELAQASREKSEFLAAVTHELKTPLNAIIGFADVLDAELAGALAPQQKAQVGEILGAGRRLLGLVGRLLELAQLDAGQTPFALQPTDVGALLAAAAAAHAAAAQARGIAIAVEAENVTAAAEPRLLRRLLDELVDNAVKFNRDGGAVTLRARRQGERIEIAVADSGAGIAAPDLARLFRPFVQLDGALTRRQGGIGIGLVLARRIAELHGGDISADSTPGAGSTFTARLPAASAKEHP